MHEDGGLDPVTRVLERAREGTLSALRLDPGSVQDHAPDAWIAQLGTQAPLPAVRSLALVHLRLTGAAAAQIARIFPGLVSLELEHLELFSGRDLFALIAELASLERCRARGLGRERHVGAPTRPWACAAVLAELELEHLDEPLEDAFATAPGALGALRVLSLGIVRDTAPLLRRCPQLRSLAIRVDPRGTRSLSLQHRILEHLSIEVAKRPGEGSIAIEGALPALGDVRLAIEGSRTVDPEGFARLLASSPALHAVTLSGGEPFRLASCIAQARGSGASRAPLRIAVAAAASAVTSHAGLGLPSEVDNPRRDDDWSCVLALVNDGAAYGVAIDAAAVWPLVDTRDRFAQVAPFLRRASRELDLYAAPHAFLLTDLRLLEGFDAVERLRVFDANALTSDGLATLVALLPSLTAAHLLHNDNPRCDRLALTSHSLRSLTLTHFHALCAFALACPALERLTLDNCDGEVLEQHPVSVDAASGAGCRCYGNLGERLLRDLLDGAAWVSLPALRELTVWHNQNAVGGPPPTYESLRVDVPCRVGHAALESLSFSSCVHLRRLTLRALPRLRAVAISDHPRPEGAGAWLERVDMVDLDPTCVVEIEGVGLQRAALPLPARGP